MNRFTISFGSRVQGVSNFRARPELLTMFAEPLRVKTRPLPLFRRIRFSVLFPLLSYPCKGYLSITRSARASWKSG